MNRRVPIRSVRAFFTFGWGLWRTDFLTFAPSACYMVSSFDFTILAL